MTQEELDAIPECGLVFQDEIQQDGSTVRRMKIQQPAMGLLWSKENNPIVVYDSTGQAWSVGTVDGVQWKKRR